MVKKSISIIIPAYNDASSIGSLLHEAQELLNSITADYEIIVTDDGSKDATVPIIEKIAKENNRIKLIRHAKNLGYGVSIKEMYFRASKELVFSCPGDGQIPVKELLKMLPALDTSDIVIGRRRKRMDNVQRNIQTRIYNLLVRTLYGLKTHDINSVKLFESKNILESIKLDCNSPFVDAELCIKTTYHGKKVDEVVIEHHKRAHSGASGGKMKIIIPTVIDLFARFPTLMLFKFRSNPRED